MRQNSFDQWLQREIYFPINYVFVKLSKTNTIALAWVKIKAAFSDPPKSAFAKLMISSRCFGLRLKLKTVFEIKISGWADKTRDKMFLVEFVV